MDELHYYPIPRQTAEATRFTLPERTSPTAKMRGTLVFEQMRLTQQRPTRGFQVEREEIGAGFNKLPVVERQGTPPAMRSWDWRRSWRTDDGSPASSVSPFS